MFVRRSTLKRELKLLQIEYLIKSRAPGVVTSSEALEGIRRQLLMALPKRHPLRRQLGARRATDAYHRMASMFMAAYSGQPGIGEYDSFRRAVIEVADSRLTHLEVLTEIHNWLETGHDRSAIKSQLEDRLTEEQVTIVRELAGDNRSDTRFRFFGEGGSMLVKSPAYIVEIDGRPSTIRQGRVHCSVPDQSDEANADDDLNKTNTLSGGNSLEDSSDRGIVGRDVSNDPSHNQSATPTNQLDSDNKSD